MNRASSATGWVRNPDGTLGWTWNPITGCLNHIDGLCKGGNFPCYAYRLANGRLKKVYNANLNHDPNMQYDDPFYPRFWPEKLKELSCFAAINEPNYLKRLPRKERGIFVCDMSDLFGIGIPEEWTRDILDVIGSAEMHRFYLLTKQPQNLIKWDFPDNCWVGVTVTNSTMLIEARHYLSGLEAQIKYISLEPFLDWTKHRELGWLVEVLQSINWVIIGAQSKPTVLPKIEWVREIVRACDKAGIPVFLKDNLKPLFEALSGIPQWAYSSKSILKQEMPK